MYVLSLCQQLCSDKLPVCPDQRLGDGADGECLTIVGEPDKVIKLGILYQRDGKSIQNRYKEVQKVLEFLIQTCPQEYVHVYQHGYLGTFDRAWRDGRQQFLMYYYIMEKLNKISEDEQKVFHSILSHEDLGIVKNFSIEKVQKMVGGMSKGLDFDVQKVSLFVGLLQASALNHLDLHPRNILKAIDGSFKCIDVDRCNFKEK